MARFRLRPQPWILGGSGRTTVSGSLQYNTSKALGSVLLGGTGHATIVSNSLGVVVPQGNDPLGVTFTLTSASTQTAAPFCIGHAFKRGQVPAGQGVTVSGTGVAGQVTPKNYWGDGSLKFAIVAGTADLTANVAKTVTLGVGTYQSGTPITTIGLKGTNIVATINAGIYGSVTWSGTDWDGFFAQWVVGHKMSSWLYRKTIGTDPHLVGWLEVRMFDGGAVEVLPWIENGYLNVANPTSKAATYSFSLGPVTASQRYSGTLDLPHHCRTPLLDGAKVSHWLSGVDPAVTPKHDVEYMQATTLVPTYDATVSPTDVPVTRQPTSFTPLAASPAMDNANGMGTGGYGNHVGLLPEWDVLYMTTTADVWKALQWTHYSMGRYATHYRDETTNKPLRFTSYPTLCLPYWISDTLMGMGHMGSSAAGTYTPIPTGTAPAGTWVDTHHPSQGFFAYLITGRYYFMEECQFAATVAYLRGGDNYRQNAKGIHNTYYEQQRGSAWQLRTLAQAMVVTPDGDPLRTEFLTSFKENITFYRNTYLNPSSNPFGFVRPYVDGDATVGDNIMWVRVFMQDFFTACMGYARDLVNDHLDSTTQGYYTALWNWLAVSVAGRMGGTGATEYLYRNAAPYDLPIGAKDNADLSLSSEPWYSHWGQVYALTYSSTNPQHHDTGVDDSQNSIDPPYYPNSTKTDGGTLNGGYFGVYSLGGGRWGYMQPALAYAARFESSTNGPANTGLSKLRNAPNWYLQQAAQAGGPITAVVPSPLPKWRRGQKINEWREISGSSMSLKPSVVENSYIPYSFGGPGHGLPDNTRVDNWASFSLDTRSGRLYSLANGGHNDYYGNEVMALDLMVDAPAWTIELEASAEADIILDSPRYADGRPSSQHTYSEHHFIERHNRAVRVGASATAGSGRSYFDVEGYDPANKQFDPQFTYPPIISNGGPPYTNALQPAAGSTHSAAGAIGWTVVKNPDTEEIYVFPAANANIRKFTPSAAGPQGTVGSAGTWTTVGASLPSTYGPMDGVGAFDTRRNRILLTSSPYPHSSNPNKFWLFDATTFSFTDITASFGNSATATAITTNLKSGPGLIYVPVLDKYFLKIGLNATGRVVMIDPATWVSTELPVIGDSTKGGTFPGSTTIDPTLYENVYGKFLYVPSLRGVFYYPSYYSNCWFLRLY